MKTMGKRVLSMLLTLCMVVGMLPAMSVEAKAVWYDPEIAPQAKKQTYFPQNAVDYANRYVWSDARVNYRDSIHPEYYNKEYYNMNIRGGDCANYVSQCLLAGGFTMDKDWKTKSCSTTGWYYGNGWSETWSNAAWLFAYLVHIPGVEVYAKVVDPSATSRRERYGNQIEHWVLDTTAVHDLTDDSQIEKGMIIWTNNTASHVEICVSSGGTERPKFNAHNDDRWQYSMSYELVWYAVKLNTCTNHTYDKNGICTNCSAKVDFSQYTGSKTVTLAGRNPATWAPGYTAMSGKYTPVSNKEVAIRNAPFQDSSVPNKLSPKSSITVTGKFWNGIKSNGEKHYWYTVDDGSGEVRYIYSNNLEKYTEPPVSNLSVNFASPSYSVDPQNDFKISGWIQSNNYSISSYTAYLDGEKITSASSGLGKSPIELADSAAVRALKSTLKRGNYADGTAHTFKIEATDSSGKTVPGQTEIIIKKPAVVTPTMETPTITYVDSTYGGKQYRIDYGNASNTGSLTYSYSGKTGSGPATIAVTADTTISATASKSGYKSASNSLTVSSSRSAAPGINITSKPDGATVMLNHTNNAAKLYYRINGDEAKLYERNTPITLSSSATITAWAEERGYWKSSESSNTYTASAPSTPDVKLASGSADIAQGRAFTVNWNRDAIASNYEVNVYRDGIIKRTEYVGDVSAYTFHADEAGKYMVRVTAMNSFGSSAASNAVAVTVHAPVTVTFKTDNGTMIEAPRTVDYGSDITPPSVPNRKGYTFVGWSRGFTNITSDVTIIANYQINTYTVTFYNVDGKGWLGSQRIQYDESIDSASMEDKLDLGGYSFGGWHISQCDADSLQDLEHIDSNMTLVATKVWNEVGQIRVTINKAERNALNTGYDVQLTLDAQDEEDLKAVAKKVKVITTLKSKDDQMLAAEITTLNVEAGDLSAPKDVKVFVSYDGTYLAKNVEVTVLGVDANDHTGGALSALVSAEPTITVAYSEWMTDSELAAKGISPSDQGVQSKTQYKYTEYTRYTTTRTVSSKSAPSVSGYTLISSTPSESWTSWSGWSDTKYTASSTREVNTQIVKVSDAYTQYRYGRWSDGTNNSYCPYAGSSSEYYGWGTPYSLWKTEYTAWTTQRYKETDTIYVCYASTHDKHITNLKGPTGWDNFRVYLPQGASYSYATRWFWEETRTVDATYKTQYQYRDKQFTYSYEKWAVTGTKDWNDTAVSSYTQTNSKKVVETRQLYRYITNDTSVTDLPSTAEVREFPGTLKWTDDDMTGKVATILVYKETNSDPTEPQLEYVKQTTIGEGNEYNFTFRPKEEPDDSTGDFIVALALEGATNVINVGKVFAPREYTVTFCDIDGNVISSQEHIPSNGSAEMVQAPEVPGYSFVCWSKDFSSVTDHLEVTPVYWPKQYSVVFVDYENGTATLKTDYAYHDLLITPDQPVAEGMTFTGWEIQSNETGEVLGTLAAQSVVSEGETNENNAATADFLVENDLIAIAKWEPFRYTVQFMDAFGDELDTQEIDCGCAAELPNIGDVPNGMEFLGWNTDVAWWNVTEDMIVYPIIIYADTTAAPVSSIGSESAGVYEKLELSAPDGATIYYTLDGSEPSPDRVANEESGNESSDKTTYIYDEAIELEETTYVRAMSRSAGKNDSEIVDIVFTYDSSNEGEISSDSLVEIGTYNMMVEPGQTVTLNFVIDSNPGLAAYEFVLDADPAVFSVLYDEDSLDPLIDEGDVCTNKGTLLLGDYQEGIGWQILWFGTSAVTEDGSLCTLELHIDDDVEAGTYPVKVSYSSSNTFSEDYFEQDLTGNVSVSLLGNVKLLGDVNVDGAVTAIDVVRIARYLIDDITFTKTQLAAADVTGDGKVTASDVIRLARYLVGLAELN